MTHDELMKRLTQMSGDTPAKRMQFYMKYIQPIKEYFKDSAVNEPENIPDIDDYPVTDSRTYKNLDGTVNWKKYAMALKSHILSNEPEKPTDEEIEKWVDERIDKVYIGYVSRGLRDSMIDAAKWMRNKLTDKERR